MMDTNRFLALALFGSMVLSSIFSAGEAGAQEAGGIAFSTELPRTLVFVAEEGDGTVATRDLSAFLREAGFPLIDPALAHTAAQRELVAEALGGDEGAATELGRDFGAQVLIIGRADWGARPDPVDGTLVTATSEVALRAIRLDAGRVIATARGEGRAIDATEQAARTRVIRQATSEILTGSSFVGQLMNDWEDTPWTDREYWRPDPGSVAAVTQVAQARPSPAPGLAILLADVRPSAQSSNRGDGVVTRVDQMASAAFNPVRLEGVVLGDVRSVSVEGKPANMEPLGQEEARQLGLEGQAARRFWAETNLPMDRETVGVVAQAASGAVSQAMAAPRIAERWAVVVGIGDYHSDEIPDLKFAGDDAESVFRFLTSPAAGPFEEDHVVFLRDEDATGDALREALFVFLQQAAKDDLVIIYFAGHGAPDPRRPDNLYLLPYDAELGSLAATGFPMWDVKTALRRQIEAERVIVFADACHAAGTQEGLYDENPIAGGFSQLFSPSRRLIMTAADTNEYSFEDARWGGHGVFTHFLMEGLEGAGDGNGNGIVTFNEAYQYVSRMVVQATEGRQNPQVSGFGDIPLAVVGMVGAESQNGGR